MSITAGLRTVSTNLNNQCLPIPADSMVQEAVSTKCHKAEARAAFLLCLPTCALPQAGQQKLLLNAQDLQIRCLQGLLHL